MHHTGTLGLGSLSAQNRENSLLVNVHKSVIMCHVNLLIPPPKLEVYKNKFFYKYFSLQYMMMVYLPVSICMKAYNSEL